MTDLTGGTEERRCAEDESRSIGRRRQLNVVHGSTNISRSRNPQRFMFALPCTTLRRRAVHADQSNGSTVCGLTILHLPPFVSVAPFLL